MIRRTFAVLLLVWVAWPAAVLSPHEAAAQGGGPAPPRTGGPALGVRQPREVRGLGLSASDELVAEIRIEGNATVPEYRILAQMETRVGRPYDHLALGRDVEKLANLPWFVDVRPLSRKTDAGLVVILRVSERSTVRYVEYLGASKLTPKKLAKETGLKVGMAVDPYAVEDGRRLIEELYHENGYSRAQVEVLEGNQPDDRGVVYVINEGVQQRVWGVKFEGNNSDFASDRRLRTKIKSKPGWFKTIGGKFKRELLDGDVRTLTAYYRAFGFFQAKVGRLLEFDDDGEWATIRFVIHEGPRYRVRAVRFMGNERFADESLASGLKLPAAEPFEQAKLSADVGWLKEVYGSHGYVFADVRAEPVFLETPGELDLVYHIEEGEKWRVGRVFVHIGGENPHTRVQTALNRLSIRPGDVLDIRELRASERRLQSSSLFLHEPRRGVTPKITYRIPELDAEFRAAAGGDPEFRGQSPPERKPLWRQVFGARKPSVRRVGSSGAVDIHLVHGHADPAKPRRVLEYAPIELTPTHASTGARPHTTRKPQQQHTQAAASGPPYGGAMPRAVSPGAAQAGYQGPIGSQPVGVTPAQFGQPFPTGPTPPAGAPAPRVMGAPLTSPQIDPSILPIPGDSLLLPGRRPGNVADIDVILQEAQTGRFMVGVGVNSDAGVVGQIMIDERNFDWRAIPTSFQDIYDGRAFRGDGQRFRIEAAPGTEVQRYLVSWQEPYWRDTPISLSLSGSYFTRRFADYDEQRLGGRVATGYQWTDNDLSAALAYRFANVEVFDAVPGVPELDEVSDRNNQLHGFGVTVTNDTRNNPFLATDGHFVSLQLEQVVGTFDYPRAILDARKYFLLSERPDHSGRQVISLSTRLGVSGSNTPIYDHFFAGGFSTLRGFDFRGAGPTRNVGGFRNVEIGGEFMWVNTAEYMFPLTADDMINGVVFCDFGTVEPSVQIDDFRVAPGVGLRLTVPALGPAPIALDFAWPVAFADTDDRQVFTFTAGFQR